MSDRNRWWKNGDHPNDKSEPVEVELPGGLRTIDLTEGDVVRRYRHPDVPGTDLCPECGQAYDVHGWLDQEGDSAIVHPGDYVVGSRRPYRVERPNATVAPEPAPVEPEPAPEPAPEPKKKAAKKT